MSTTDCKYWQLEKEDGIGILTINRPKALNALNPDVINELDKWMDTIEKDGDIKVLIITGGGRAFIAGADIAEMPKWDKAQGKEFAMHGSGILRKLEQFKIPTIGALNGFTLGGGCELALCLDMRIASDQAKLGLPEVSLGILPGFGGTQRLPRLCGMGIAKELIYTAKMIDAAEAFRIGLVNKLVPADQLMDEAKGLAKAIMKNGPMGVINAKQAINDGYDMDIDDALACENNAFAKAFGSKDRLEGVTAFLEKRKPDFKGE